MMRSRASLTYEEVQAAQDGDPNDRCAPLMDTVIAPLYGPMTRSCGRATIGSRWSSTCRNAGSS